MFPILSSDDGDDNEEDEEEVESQKPSQLAAQVSLEKRENCQKLMRL